MSTAEHSLNTAAPRARPRAIAPLHRRVRRNAGFYLFTSPFFILFFVFGLFPIVFAFVLSFTNWPGLGPLNFVGLQNYAYLFQDPLFHRAILNTLVFLVGSTGSLIFIALLLALLFHRLKPRFNHVLRTIFFLPMLVSTVAMAQIFTALFTQQSGFVNFALSLVTGDPAGDPVQIGWLTDPAYAKLVVTMQLWWKGIGLTTIIFIVAMEAISQDLYDAADVDGASNWQLLRHVVVPMLKPILIFITILSIIGGFQMFAEVFALWGGTGAPMGGPANAAMTTAVYLYQVAFGWGEYGLGAAVSYLMFLMIAGFSFVYYRLQVRGELT